MMLISRLLVDYLPRYLSSFSRARAMPYMRACLMRVRSARCAKMRAVKSAEERCAYSGGARGQGSAAQAPSSSSDTLDGAAVAEIREIIYAAALARR